MKRCVALMNLKLQKFQMIKLNIGCGADLRQNYINIDIQPKDELFSRYGYETPSETPQVFNYDIFNLPFLDGQVDEVMCHGFLEHLSFEEEGRFLNEVKRVLKAGAPLHFTVPDEWKKNILGL